MCVEVICRGLRSDADSAAKLLLPFRIRLLLLQQQQKQQQQPIDNSSTSNLLDVSVPRTSRNIM